MKDCCTVYCTAATREEALAIGRALVGERLAACANVLDGMTSIYHWEERLQESAEAVLLLKTRRELAPRVIARIQALHSYDCPCVASWAIEEGHAPYLDWVRGETASPAAAAPPE